MLSAFVRTTDLKTKYQVCTYMERLLTVSGGLGADAALAVALGPLAANIPGGRHRRRGEKYRLCRSHATPSTPAGTRSTAQQTKVIESE